MKILVFDDSRENQESARLSLADHDLTVVGTYDEAQAALSPQVDRDRAKEVILPRLLSEAGLSEASSSRDASEEDRNKYWDKYEEAMEQATTHPDFDVVMTDVLVPASRQAMGREGMRFVGEEMPLGPTIALLALSIGVRNVAVVTDMSHHDHPASAAFDCMNGDKCQIEGVNLLCTNRVGHVQIDEETGKMADHVFLDSDEGKKKHPFAEGRDYGPRQGILIGGKHWGNVLHKLLGDGEGDDD